MSIWSAPLFGSTLTECGKVMAALKARYAGQMDMSAANALVKAALERGSEDNVTAVVVGLGWGAAW